jgi:predicted dithiol-disulfide oxidoreductase (DUF899 family)
VTEHKVGTREEWLAARIELLDHEKELTRRSDELARERRELPWVPVGEPYSFETDEGTKTLAELFEGRSQLLVFHLMFGPEDAEACPGCSFTADHVDGAVVHLNHRDVTFVAVSRAPLEKLSAYKRRMGWSLPGFRRLEPTSTSTSPCSPKRSDEPAPGSTSARNGEQTSTSGKRSCTA